MKLLRAIVNCEQIVTVCSNGDHIRTGTAQDRVDLIERKQTTTDSVGCAIVFDTTGSIVAVGHDDVVLQQLSLSSFTDSNSPIGDVIDGVGCTVIPGLIDAHCHPVWAGDRVNEFDLKLRGASYLDIHQQGGGIHYTVNETRKVSKEELLRQLLTRINQVVSCGTTVLECKTGYGLNTETELKMLQVIACARKTCPIELVSTFLGAHAVPLGMNSAEGVTNVLAMIDQINSMEQKQDLAVEFVDVFCEKGVYDIKQSELILNTARQAFPGSDITFHGDELCDLGAGSMAARIGALSVSHLEYVNEQSIEQMATAMVSAIVCPTTCYLLRLPVPPVRRMINAGVPIVIASDYNPNAMCYSLPMAMNLAAVNYGMTLNECLVACTINAAYALKRSHTNGSLEVNKRGDCIMLNAPDWRHLIYQFGDTSTQQLIRYVLKDGHIVHPHPHHRTSDTDRQ